MLKKIFTPRWIIATLLVIAAVGVMIRLGLWQLDRLEQRRAYNARVNKQLDQPILDLNQNAADPSLSEMEYRSVRVTGRYLPEEQIALRNQVYQGQPGYHLLTPLQIDGTDQVVLVDRGWIPLAANRPEDWTRYHLEEPVLVEGVIRRSVVPGRFGLIDPPLPEGQKSMRFWNRVTLERIREQVSQPILPVYIQQTGEPANEGQPVPEQVSLDLSEGSHLGYALQWFAFAAVLAAGYPIFVRRQIAEETRLASRGSDFRTRNSEGEVVWKTKK